MGLIRFMVGVLSQDYDLDPVERGQVQRRKDVL